jgi:hypothetical protein
MYVFENYKAELYLPVIKDKFTSFRIFEIADSLARIGGYNNLRLIQNISRIMVNKYAYKRTDDCYNCENTEMTDWQKELLIKFVEIDIKYCIRVSGSSSIIGLPSFLFTQSIINEIKKLYLNPLLSRNEAEIIAQREIQSEKPDTFGYDNLKKKFYMNDLNKNELVLYNYLTSLFFKIDKVNMNLEQYYDSINQDNYEYVVNKLEGEPFREGFSLITTLREKRIYPLAMFIDSLRNSDGGNYWNRWGKIDVDFILARLNYMDYPQQQMDKYNHIVDTCIHYLNKNTHLNMYEVADISDMIFNSTSHMIQINPSEACYKMAPLLLVKNILWEQFWEKTYSIGALYLYNLGGTIVNMPLYDLPVWEIDSKNGYLETMYQWMLDNKDNYQINPIWMDGGKTP